MRWPLASGISSIERSSLTKRDKAYDDEKRKPLHSREHERDEAAQAHSIARDLVGVSPPTSTGGANAGLVQLIHLSIMIKSQQWLLFMTKTFYCCFSSSLFVMCQS